MAVKTKPSFRAAVAKEIPQAGAEFEKALKACEKALATEPKSRDLRAIDNCVAAVEAVGAAAEKAIKANKNDKETVAFLKQYGPLVAAEVKRLEEAKKDAASGPTDEEETSDESVSDAKHLSQCIKLLRNRALNFACGVHSKAEQSIIIFDRKKAPKRLFHLLMGNKELNLSVKQLTFGTAYPGPDDNSTMVLQLDDQAEQPLGLIKKMRKLFKKNKEEYRPFRDVQLVVCGQVVADIPDPEDTEPDEGDAPKNGQIGAEAIESTASPADRRRGQFPKKAAQLREARQLWLQACDQARKDMVQVKSALRKAYRRDTVQLPLVMQKTKLLDAIFDGQSAEIRTMLDSYIKLSPTNTQAIDRLKTQLIASLRTIRSRISENPLLAAIDEDQDLVSELKIKAPLLDALKRLEKALAT